MITCPTCHNSNKNTSRFCDNCGTRIAEAAAPPPIAEDPPAYVPPPATADSFPRPVSVTSIGVPPAVFADPLPSSAPVPDAPGVTGTVHATMLIERGDGPGTEFKLVNNESTIGRWDADNGVFPDIDLDAFDSDAKVSRKHAKIYRSNGSYFIEDLGSTNGTYVNRGRRLLPGTPQQIKDGDEVIVGKTFLRFHIVQ
ncbi:MAG TPA: FHA domain-containing protein [Pyrinomonadaceae bacterium]|jgi:serine/threonine-protein kinase|nr:FHA domain-containing protein [Pyrinomonadaceae bacterium]